MSSVYFIISLFGLEEAFQWCYVKAVTGTDVDLWDSRKEVWVWRDQKAEDIAHSGLKNENIICGVCVGGGVGPVSLRGR